MPAYDPPLKGVEYIFYFQLQDMANPGSFKASPTLAGGDFNELGIRPGQDASHSNSPLLHNPTDL